MRKDDPVGSGQASSMGVPTSGRRGRTQGSRHYEIRVGARLDERWSEWLGGLTAASVGDEETVLSGELVDQAALHGVLAWIRDHNLTLLSVQLVESDPDEIAAKERKGGS